MSFKVSVISCLRLGRQICAKEHLSSFEVPFVLPIVTAELQINSRETLLDIFLKDSSEGLFEGAGRRVYFVSVDQRPPSALQLML